MKISFVMSNCPRKPTGGHKIVFEYANYLARNNNVTIYFGYAESFSRFHFPVFLKEFLARTATKYFRPNWFKLINVHKVCVKNFSNNSISNSDIVIATDVKTAIPVFGLEECKGKKMYFIQDFENWNVSDEYVKSTYCLNMKKIVVSKWLRELIGSLSDDSNIYYISNSINTNIFKNTNEVRKDHSIVFQYRSNIAKGCKYAIDVISKLRIIYSDLLVTIISNEKKLDNIPSWCEYRYNVSQLEVAKINNSSQVFICTSIEEGFGLPGLEAMACGCAVASTAYKGVYEYAIDGENALLSPPRDVDAMVTNIRKLFDDDALRNRIVENGIKTGKERSLEKSAEQFERIMLRESST